jgi:uncharacterized membrane protein
MAVELLNQTFNDGIASSMANAVANIPGMGAIMEISRAIGIVVLIYLAILIFKAIVQTRQALNFKKLTNNVEEINKKMDILIGKREKKR